MKRLGVLGTLVWDRIWHPSGAGRPVEQWGGIAYSLAAATASCPPGWEIAPLSRVGADLASEADSFLRSLSHIAPGAGLTPVAQLNNRVELVYVDAVSREERLSGGVSGWSWRELAPRLEELDALYVNFVSGFELDLETASLLRSLPIPVYADLHSLYLGRPGEGARLPRRLPDWRQWMAPFGAVQLNESELALTGPSRDEALDILPELCRAGPVLAVVTLGGSGAAYADRSGGRPAATWPSMRSEADSAEVATGTVATPAGELSGDPTGCGDVWGSVLFTGLLAGLRLEPAIRRAHEAAAVKLRAPRVADLSGAILEALDRPGDA